MTQCYLEGDLKNKNQDKSILCHLACHGGKNNNKINDSLICFNNNFCKLIKEKTNNKCIDSFDIPEINEHKNKSNKAGLILKPGIICIYSTFNTISCLKLRNRF